MKNKLTIYLYLFFLISMINPVNGQHFSIEKQAQIDSLNSIIYNPKTHDTTLALSYFVLSEILYLKNRDTLKYLSDKVIKVSEKGLSKNQSLQVQKNLNTLIARALNNIGFYYTSKGDVPNALKYYHKSLKIHEKVENKKGIASSFNNIGYIHKEQGDDIKALEYFQKSLKIKEEIGDKKGMAITINNIGIIYKNQGNQDKAIEYYLHSLKIKRDLGETRDIGVTLNNIGVIYSNQESYLKAMDFFKEGLKISQETNDQKTMIMSLTNIGIVQDKLGNIRQAIQYGERSLTLSKEIQSPEQIRGAAHLLTTVYKRKGNYKKAYEMRNLEIKMDDSLNNEATQKATAQQQAKYEYEKRKATDSIINAEANKVKDALLLAEQQENEKNKTKAEKQTQQTYFLFGILGLALIFGGVVFNRFRTTQKQKRVIEKQKVIVDKAFDELAEKNSEILDSINYAKRIQSAILPPNKLIKEYLTSSFILYQPKDIVAGDFYWMEAMSEGVLFAAADCTGHGVPGAMVSVVCNNGLNRSVREYGLTDPGEILNKTREIVIQEFEKSEEVVKDGMDIALCKLSNNYNYPKTLQYAGAHNPLWIIRKNAIEVEEIKANKQPIGKFLNELPYTTHTVELNEGDTIYLFSDGYTDQFGGERGKKFKSVSFKKLLLSIQHENMENQHIYINNAFEEWKGDLEQLDDVCVIGVRV